MYNDVGNETVKFIDLLQVQDVFIALKSIGEMRFSSEIDDFAREISKKISKKSIFNKNLFAGDI